MHSPHLSIEKWRFTISRTLWVVSVLTFFVELTVFFLLTPSKLGFDGRSPMQYLLEFLLIPTAFNFLASLLNHLVQHYGKISETGKNYSVAIFSAVIAFIISFTHYIAVLSLAAFVFPIFMTVLFGEKQITRNITILSAGLAVVAIFHATVLISELYFFINIFASVVLLIIAYYVTNILIAYIKENNQLIIDSLATQQALIEKAKTDPLTGLYNHSIFMKTLNDCIGEFHKEATPFCVCMIDIDNFKAVNDTYGHLAGNLVLIELSKLLKELKERFPNDETLLFRYGGEEFGIIFKNQTADKVYPKVENLRKDFSEMQYPSLGDRHITFSAGITEYQGDVILEDLFNIADAALYHAKDCGKNQTSIL